jgi:methyl-accepting chemotaxis protein
LYKGIKKVTKGDLKYRVDIHTGDEIEELGKAFNEMAEELEQYQNKTDESKTVLQIKVKARIKELEELNETLEIKVGKRTEEFKKRLDQLEKFHRITLGRELKMIELKKELQKLESKGKKR